MLAIFLNKISSIYSYYEFKFIHNIDKKISNLLYMQQEQEQEPTITTESDTQSAAVTSSRQEQEQIKTTKKQYVRKFTDEGRAKQKQHLDEIRKKDMEKKKEMREITLKAKLMKLEPKLNLAKKYDEYITSKLIKPH